MLDGLQFANMIHAGAANLQAQAQTVNNLNVFPIPDGDTGDNMLLTVLGGARTVGSGSTSVSESARRVADGMLLSARGNSGVILSQFFDGIAEGLEGKETANPTDLGEALRCGVRHAYHAVMEPTEGTILTVARQGAEAACTRPARNTQELLSNFIAEARTTLNQTPEMLSVLKKAGVVDSGGAGLILIAEGMARGLSEDAVPLQAVTPQEQDIDLNLFTEDSILEYGYCTELLLRLQRVKTDPEQFEVSMLTDYLRGIGDSVVACKTGSMVKIHVHTMTPDKVLSFCQRYGEFLKIKIENMSLQHNNTALEGLQLPPQTERKPYGIVAVCSGSGVKEFFQARGADVIVEGGQSRNPSTEEFLKAFRAVQADTILVLPNNSNIILTAKQAAELYPDADVRVIESHTIGDGYAALSMLDLDCGDTDAIVQNLNEAMEGVVTAAVSRSIRDTEDTVAGDYIGFVGKEILCDHENRLTAAKQTLDRAGFVDYDICMILYGNTVSQEEASTLEAHIHANYPGKEVYVINGQQDIYDYIFIME